MQFKIEYNPNNFNKYWVYKKDKILLIFSVWTFIASFDKLTDAEIAIVNSKGYPKYYEN